VHDKMKEIGAQLLVKTVKEIAEGTLKEIPQSSISGALKHAPKIFTETCKIDFSKTVEEVHNLIRGLSPFPGAFTYLNDKMLKVYRSEKEITPNPPGEEALKNYITDGKTFLKFACANGYVHIKELQLEGKKKMQVDEFLRGYRF
jgi:methionyl-tRNA formyltransferase